MLRWLVVVITGFILYKLIRNEIAKRAKDRQQASGAKAKKAPTGDMVQDPVCGSYVEVASSVSVRDGTIVHRFCSYECRDAFLEQRGSTPSMKEKNGGQGE